jgi:hypothetical protein
MSHLAALLSYSSWHASEAVSLLRVPLRMQRPAPLPRRWVSTSLSTCAAHKDSTLILQLQFCQHLSPAESRTPALTLGELKGTSLAGAPAGSDDTTATTTTTSSSSSSGQKDSGLLDKPRQPVIFSPKEPTGSLGEGSVGVSAGDPAGGANIVAAARTAGKGIMVSARS